MCVCVIHPYVFAPKLPRPRMFERSHFAGIQHLLALPASSKALSYSDSGPFTLTHKLNVRALRVIISTEVKANCVRKMLVPRSEH